MGYASLEDSTDAAASKLLSGVTELTTKLEVPTLQEFGVGESEFKSVVRSMSEAAMASGSPANNPVVPTALEIENLYDDVYFGSRTSS